MAETLSEYLRLFNGNSLTVVGPLIESPSSLPQPAFSDPVIFVDGGVKARQSGEGFAVGDGDSVDASAKTALNQHLPQEKDYSDLSFVLSQLPSSIRELCLHGFLGGRRDHELFNLGEVHHFLRAREKGCRVRIFPSVEAMTRGHWQLKISQTFSVMSFDDLDDLKISGDCRYPYSGAWKRVSSQGLSNEGRGTVVFESSGPFFVLLEDGVH